MRRAIVAPRAGFCFGVKRAVEMAERTVAAATGPVATLGPLIHNPLVVKDLADRGVRVVDRVEEAGSGTLIIRSHGVPPEEIDLARRIGLTVVDATCPFVRKAQRLAEDLAVRGYQVVVIGDPAHPEIKSVVAAAGRAPVMVISGADELALDGLRRKVGLICQTTLPSEALAAAVAVVAPACKELVVHNTICTATQERQRAAVELAKRVDAMVVVGGSASANTAHLAGVCRRVVPTYQVEKSADLDPAWFVACQTVGITAGASTPAAHIEKVKKDLEEMLREGKR